MKFRTFNNRKLLTEHDFSGAEFSVLNSQDHFKELKAAKTHKADIPTNFLYLFSILSIGSWLLSLNILPFGDIFQFLLGAVVLVVNFFIFKYTKA